MALILGDNFSYGGSKPLDARLNYSTLSAMKAVADSTMYNGCIAYCVETDKTYQWKSTNTVDTDTGRWREFSSGNGGESGGDATSMLTGTLVASSWSSNTQTVNVSGMTTSTKGIVGLLDTATSAQVEAAKASGIVATAIGNDTVTFKCDKVPNVDIPFGILVPGTGSSGGSDIDVDDALSSTSENPVQNKVVKTELDKKIAYTPSSTTTSPMNTDRIELVEPSSGDSFFLKAITWENIKAALKTYFDAIYGYVLPKASSSTLGGIKVGSNLSIQGDGTLNASTSALFNYSTTEKVIGTWIDGKPLYQKVITKSIGNGSITITPKTEISNIKNIVNEVVLGKNSSLNYEPLPITQSSGAQVKMSYTKKGVSPEFSDDPLTYTINCTWTGTGHGVALILQYTKTTD